MNKIVTALAVLAVIAEGTLAAVVQQLQPEEYETIENAVSACKQKGSIYETMQIGDDVVAVLHQEKNDSYFMAYLQKSGEGYLLKQETAAVRSPMGFSESFKYSKKETAIVAFSPDEKGKMTCSLKIEIK